MLHLLQRLHRAWEQHILRRWHIPFSLWHQVTTTSHALGRLSDAEKVSLREIASLFLHRKTFTPAGGMQLTDYQRIYIAAHACLPVLNLGLDFLDGWHEIIVYPETFVIRRDQIDSAGVVHPTALPLAGEAWLHGPLILSWSDIESGNRQARQATHPVAANVIVHEIAHKLDMLNGSANGLPPLHSGMEVKSWADTMTQAYQQLLQQLEPGNHPPHPAPHRSPTPHPHHLQRPPTVNPYAATNPAEFFAVLTELFFEQPGQLQQIYPQVYELFAGFYRQNRLSRD